jgi:hypothetical protein
LPEGERSELREQATRQAEELGTAGLSSLPALPAAYLDQLATRSLTEQINEALATADDDSNAAAAAAGRSYLARQDDW